MEKNEEVTLADIGEFGFIEMLRSRFGSNLCPGVLLGIGDDVAVVDCGGPEYILATCDAQIGNVHFPLEITPSYDLGRRIVEVNASDIASMGGSPRWALVGLNVPSTVPLSFLEGFYSGVNDALARIGACLIGGNCAGTGAEMVIDLFLMGTVPKGQLIMRKGASPGDIIFLTGTLGRARAGLEVVLGDPEMLEKLEDVVDKARELFFRPVARVMEGRCLAESGCVTAMIDVSDGFIQDLQHLARENRLDAVVELSRVPVDPLCRKIAEIMGIDPVIWALSGGEDYELLFAVPENRLSSLMAHYETPENCHRASITPVGSFREGTGNVFLVDKGGNIVPASDLISSSGWNHFRS